MPHNTVETAREVGASQTLLTAVEAAGLGEAQAPDRITPARIRHDSEPKTVEGGLLEIADRVLIPAA